VRDSFTGRMLNKDLYMLTYGNILSNHGGDDARERGKPLTAWSGKRRNQGHRADCGRRNTVLPGPPRTSEEKTGKSRRSAIPPWSDKLVGEVARPPAGGMLEADVLPPGRTGSAEKGEG